MKSKLLLSTIPLALLGAVGTAHAQSSVTLYGVLDTALTYVNHADGNQKLFGMNSGNLQGSRWGLKGSEDLGSGLSAVFQLENGFDSTNGKLGQGSREFGRQAFVGLSSTTGGTVTLGRQYDPLIDLIQGMTADNYFGSVFATAGDVDNYDNSFRVNNAVKYTSPVWSGLQFEMMYSFGNLSGTTGAENTYSGAVAYNNGPIGLSAGYIKMTNSPATAALRTTWTSSSDGTFDGPVNSGYATAHSISIARAAGQYVLGAFTMGASYSNAQYKPDGSSVFTTAEKYNTGQAFLNYQATPAMLVGAGYSFTKSSGDTAAKYHQVSIGADYSLSKRTDIYVVGAYQHASGETGNGTGGTMAAEASIGSYGYGGTSTQEMVNVGIRHKF
ncbi:MAG: porin [Janthinobacterium lividum]